MNNNARGKKYYELADQGMSNGDIATRCGDFAHAVAARISEYKRKNRLPPPRRGTAVKIPAYKAAAKKNEEARAETHRLAFVRGDGVLECPARYCSGYGFDRGSNLS